jgi:hypothetical protein
VVTAGQDHLLGMGHDGSERIKALAEMRRAALPAQEHRRGLDPGVDVQARPNSVQVAWPPGAWSPGASPPGGRPIATGGSKSTAPAKTAAGAAARASRATTPPEEWPTITIGWPMSAARARTSSASRAIEYGTGAGRSRRY